MSDIVLVGPFWTRAETAEYLGISSAELVKRRDVLRIEGRWLEETYPALQFSDHEVRHEVAAVVAALGDQLPGAALADWLTRPNVALGAVSPLAWFDAGMSVNKALQVAASDIGEAWARMTPAPPIAAAG